MFLRRFAGPSSRRVAASMAATSLAVTALVTASPAAGAGPGEPPGRDATAPRSGPADRSAPAERSGAPFPDGRYVVVMKDPPVVAYEGDVAGYSRTKPVPGAQPRVTGTEAQSYRGYLRARQDRALRAAGSPRVLHRYDTTLSGFAAQLTGAEAAALARDPLVLSVTEDVLRQPDTVDSPAFLGLSGPGGLWSTLGGTAARKGAGSGVVVGVIDTGIWPESAAFAENGMRPPRDWAGTCQSGELFRPADCSNKLVGARYFVAGFGADRVAEHDYLSPRDADSHGTHTASTAAGNYGPRAVSDGRDFGVASGMAPAAHVAAYKVCWDAVDGGGGCAGSDSVAAIDQAVRDGVDVLNFSISGTSSNFLDPVELAFLYAADAGVFVAASSGNTGPGAATTNHPSPWLTTVAASTHTVNESTVRLGDGRSLVGASLTRGIDQTPLVLADRAVAAGAGTEQARLCYPATLDPAAVTGRIVVCDRGVIGRAEKSRAVAQAGGVGMILLNTGPSSINADNHYVPTVHLPAEHRDAVRAYADTQGATAAILAGVREGSTTAVPEVIDFSSRGPSRGAGGDVLKPDLSAPGVDVIAATSPAGNDGRAWDFMSGTSMSAPHVAGLGALLKAARPRWSPMAIKSAMMTTARKHASPASNDVFAGGAGFVAPRRFLDPGLVYDSRSADWWGFLAGQGVTYADGAPVTDTPIDASDLNAASIAVGALDGTQTVRRTVTNVGDEPAMYTARVTGLDGIDVEVSPSTLQLRRGRSATFTVTFTRTDAALDSFAQGHLVWADGTHTVRSPVAVRPVDVLDRGR